MSEEKIKIIYEGQEIELDGLSGTGFNQDEDSTRQLVLGSVSIENLYMDVFDSIIKTTNVIIEEIENIDQRNKALEILIHFVKDSIEAVESIVEEETLEGFESYIKSCSKNE